jgi:hypothetical protein
MNKQRTKKPALLAKWSSPLNARVRLTLPPHMAADFQDVLVDVMQTQKDRISSPAGAAKAAAQNLATEMLCRRPMLCNLELKGELRLTVPHSEALTLLAWLMSSPRTDDAAAPLRLLIDALYRLLS